MTDILKRNKGPLKKAARALSDSLLLKRGRELWAQNALQWEMPLSKWDKLWCGAYIILRDYSDHIFPPKFEDQSKAYENEINYTKSLPGYTVEQAKIACATKPLWGAKNSTRYMAQFNRLYSMLESVGVRPPQKLLELGCGCGWMAEFLAVAGYSVLGTSISPIEIEWAKEKVKALECKQTTGRLSFLAEPMESADTIPGGRESFDAVYIYEALHHAYDWRKAIKASANLLKKGGWLLLANEPNVLHTFISYRVARLSKTHEIGFHRSELISELKGCGFDNIEVLAPKWNNWVRAFWIIAQKS
jgi:2-polyprenyl-3-methyl-5-hydroxy-6-metoxy-1,4-benzoquinol methylase